MKTSEFIRYLKKHNCIMVREGSKHSIYANAEGKQSSVPRHKEIDNRLCKIICKQLEIPAPY